MPRHFSSTLLTALALAASAAAAPASATAAPSGWPQTEVGARGTLLVDAALGPDGRPIALLGRTPAPGRHEVELRTGREIVRVGRTSYVADAVLDTDAEGSATVARPSAPGDGPRGIVVWSAAGEARIDTGGARPALLRLDVAPDGSAVVTWTTEAGIFAARRRPGLAWFEGPEPTGLPATPSSTRAAVALAGGGAIVLAGEHVTRTLDVAQEFAPPARIALPDGVRRTTHTQLVVSGSGDALVVLRSHTRHSGTAPDDQRRIVAVPWSRVRSGPGRAVTLSRTRLPGRPVATATGDGFAVLFKETRTADRGGADLHALFLNGDGARTAEGVARGAGAVAADLAAAPDGDGGVRAFTAGGGALRSVRFSGLGDAGRWSTVARDRSLRRFVVVGGERPAVLWTSARSRVVQARAPR